MRDYAKISPQFWIGKSGKALRGDRVLASVTSIDRRGRREGAIVEVLEHRLTRLTGRYSERSRIGMVVPDDRRVLTEVLIPPEDRNEAREGQLVVVDTAGLAITMATRFLALVLRTLGSLRLMADSSGC